MKKITLCLALLFSTMAFSQEKLEEVKVETKKKGIVKSPPKNPMKIRHNIRPAGVFLIQSLNLIFYALLKSDVRMQHQLLLFFFVSIHPKSLTPDVRIELCP